MTDNNDDGDELRRNGVIVKCPQCNDVITAWNICVVCTYRMCDNCCPHNQEMYTGV